MTREERTEAGGEANRWRISPGRNEPELALDDIWVSFVLAGPAIVTDDVLVEFPFSSLVSTTLAAIAFNVIMSLTPGGNNERKLDNSSDTYLLCRGQRYQ